MSDDKKETPPFTLEVNGQVIGRFYTLKPAEVPEGATPYKPTRDTKAAISELWNVEVPASFAKALENEGTLTIREEGIRAFLRHKDGTEEAIEDMWWNGTNLSIQLVSGRVWTYKNVRVKGGHLEAQVIEQEFKFGSVGREENGDPIF